MTAVVTGALAALFLVAAGTKLLGHPYSLKLRDGFGISPTQWRRIGLLELAGAVGVLIGLAWSPIGIAASSGLTLLSVGAVATHRRAGDPPRDAIGAVVALGLSITTLILQASG